MRGSATLRLGVAVLLSCSLARSHGRCLPGGSSLETDKEPDTRGGGKWLDTNTGAGALDEEDEDPCFEHVEVLDAYEVMVRDLDADVTDLMRDMSTVESEVATLTEQKDHLLKEIQALKADNAAWHVKLRASLIRNDELGYELEEARSELSSSKSDLSECGCDLARAERVREEETGRADEVERWLEEAMNELHEAKAAGEHKSERLLQAETSVLQPLARELVPIAIAMWCAPVVVIMSLYFGLVVVTLLAFAYRQVRRIPPVRDMVRAFLLGVILAVTRVVAPFLGVIRALMDIYSLLPLRGVREYIAAQARAMANRVSSPSPMSISSVVFVFAFLWFFGTGTSTCPACLAIAVVCWFQAELMVCMLLSLVYTTGSSGHRNERPAARLARGAV